MFKPQRVDKKAAEPTLLKKDAEPSHQKMLDEVVTREGVARAFSVPLVDSSAPTSSINGPASRPVRPLRAVIVVAVLALVGVFGVFPLHYGWERLNEIEQEPNDAGTLHVEYCPNLAVYAASGARFTDILSNTRWASFHFRSNIPEDVQPLIVDETRMLNVLGKVGVRWLSYGLVRLRSLQLTVRFVSPSEAEDAKQRPTLSNTAKQWTLVATGNPAGEYCERPTLLNTTRFLLGIVAREGYVTVGQRRDMFHMPPAMHIGDGGAPNKHAFSVADVYAYLVLHLLLTLAGTAFFFSLIDDGALALYRSVARDLMPPGSLRDAQQAPAWDTAGPIFLADNLTKPERGPSAAGDFFAALRILLVVLLPTYFVFPLLAFSPDAIGAAVCAYIMYAYLAVAAIHTALYLLAVPFRARAWVAFPFLVLWALFVLFAVFGTLKWLLWMMIFLSFDPVSVSTMLIAAVSSIVFLYSSAKTIRALLEADDVPLAFKRFDAALTKQDLLVNVCAFTALTLVTAAVVLWGWILLTPQDERNPKNVSSFVMMGIVPAAEYFTSVRMKAYAQHGSEQIQAEHAAA